MVKTIIVHVIIIPILFNMFLANSHRDKEKEQLAEFIKGNLPDGWK